MILGGGRGRVGSVSRAGNGSWLGWALPMPEMVEISVLQRCYGGDGCSVGLCGPCWVLGGHLHNRDRCADTCSPDRRS